MEERQTLNDFLIEVVGKPLREVGFTRRRTGHVRMEFARVHGNGDRELVEFRKAAVSGLTWRNKSGNRMSDPAPFIGADPTDRVAHNRFAVHLHADSMSQRMIAENVPLSTLMKRPFSSPLTSGVHRTVRSPERFNSYPDVHAFFATESQFSDFRECVAELVVSDWIPWLDRHSDYTAVEAEVRARNPVLAHASPDDLECLAWMAWAQRPDSGEAEELYGQFNKRRQTPREELELVKVLLDGQLPQPRDWSKIRTE